MGEEIHHRENFPVFRRSDNLFLRTNEKYPPPPLGLLPSPVLLEICKIFGREWLCLTNLYSCLDPELPGTGLQGGGGQMRGLARLICRNRVSWNPAEMGETWYGARKNSFDTWCRRFSGRQSEKISSFYIPLLNNKWLLTLYYCVTVITSFHGENTIIWCCTICIDPLSISKLNITSWKVQLTYRDCRISLSLAKSSMLY